MVNLHKLATGKNSLATYPGTKQELDRCFRVGINERESCKVINGCVELQE